MPGRGQRARKLWFPPRGFKSSVTSVQQHEIHALLGGAGFLKPFFWWSRKRIPMLMIHGALASRRYLMPTAKLLIKHMPVYVLELPGHGASSKPVHALSVEEQASLISQWLDANKLKKVFVYANSYGCQVAAQLAVDRPDVMAGLVLTGPTVDPEAPTIIQQWLRLNLDGMAEPFTAQLQMIIDIRDMGINRGFQTAEQMMRNDITKNLRRIRCRALVLRGENDPIAPQRWIEKLSKMMPNAKWAVIENAPHCINFTSPEELSKILLQFTESRF